MEKVKKIFNIYNYYELNKKIQDELLEKEINYCIDDYCEFMLEEDLQNYAQELLKKYFGQKAEFKNVYYDLSYSQCSGAMIIFNLKYYNSEILIKHYGNYYNKYCFELDYKNYNYLTEKREKYLKEKILYMNSELEKYAYELINYKNFINEAEEILKEKKFLINGEIFE